MNVKKDDDGEIVLESEDHSISFSFNRQITPEDKDKEANRNRMISDVMSTPRSSGRKSMNDMDKSLSQNGVKSRFCVKTN